jgi:hypothetical protein
MNLKEVLVPTNDLAKMAEIGQKIWESMPDTYNDRRRKLLLKMLNEEMPDASEEEKDRRLYISIYDYWMYGVNLKEEFSLHFTEMPHEKKQEYITFRNRFLYTHYLNDEEYAFDLLEDKYNAYLKLQEYYLRDIICIESEKDFDEFKEFVGKHPTFVVKPISLGYGWGVHKRTISPEEDLHEVFTGILAEGNAIQQKHHIKTHTTRFVLEELIDQSEKMGCLHPDSVNVVRLTTIVVGDEVYFFSPRIKMGRHGNFISNVGDDGISVGIDQTTGLVDTNASDEFGHVYEYHPDTNIKFIGFQIPEWDELLKMAKKIALSLAPRIRYVGWDMAYTNAGWSILEGNPEGEFSGQFIYKRGEKKALEDIIGWKPAVEYWWEDPVATKIG